MALKKSEKNMLILLGVVVVGAGIYQFIIYPSQQENETTVPPQKNAAKTTAAAVNTEKAVKPRRVLPVEGKRFETWQNNPFSPVDLPQPDAERTRAGQQTREIVPEEKTQSTENEAEVEPPTLNGIVEKGTRRLAIIDGHVLGVGEEKNRIRVISISEDSVVCFKKNKRFTLHWR